MPTLLLQHDLAEEAYISVDLNWSLPGRESMKGTGREHTTGHKRKGKEEGGAIGLWGKSGPSISNSWTRPWLISY